MADGDRVTSKDMLYQPDAMPSFVSANPQVLQMLIDPFTIIERIRRDLRGEVYDTRKRKWKRIGMRQMNDKGIEYVVSKLNKYINRNTILSTLKEKEVYDITRTIAINLNNDFYAKGEDWGVDPNLKASIKDDIVNLCFLALKQAQDGQLLKALTQAYSVREVRGIGKEGGKGVFDTLLSPFRGDK